MPVGSRQRVLVCGGAGFIGSHVARHFVRADWHVTVLDGFLPRTGGNHDHLADLRTAIELIEAPVERAPNLAEVISTSTVVVDCMGWTHHREAAADPVYDLQLNLLSHLHLLAQVAHPSQVRLIYLGTRHEYGQPRSSEIDEETPLDPLDVQSIHKAAADHHFRAMARARGCTAISLRFGNTFGEDQPAVGDDVGLIGGFIRDLLSGGEITVFDGARRRNCIYVKDVAEAVLRCAEADLKGFQPLNVSGTDLTVLELAQAIVDVVGSGSLRVAPMPPEFRASEVGRDSFVGRRWTTLLGDQPRTDLLSALRATVAYVRQRSVTTSNRPRTVG
jgi:UDP-glucose 4-epimerase